MSVSFIKFTQDGSARSHTERLALLGATTSMVRKMFSDNVTINTVFPRLFDKDVLRTNLHGHAKRANATCDAIVQNCIKACPDGQFSDHKGYGDLITYTCSFQVGFKPRQNIVNVGGVYQGML
ncbi:MAG: hypothetical protein P8M25_12490 [Paracoccaceae bacterium]|nr:hypothetical protein [Paracoccaceae bacterium]